MKTTQFKRVLFLTVLVLAGACGKKSMDEDDFQSQVRAAGDQLLSRMAVMPVAATAAANQNPDLGPVLAYAYPKATQVYIADSRSNTNMHAAYSSGGTTPGGVSWYRQGSTYVNGYGQYVNVGGGAATGPAGGYGRWGYGYNTANGNRVSGGLVYVPGYGVGVGVHACSPGTAQCGTAVAGPGGFAYCVNGQCAGSNW